MTHHTRQSAIGLPRIETRTYQGRTVSLMQKYESRLIVRPFSGIHPVPVGKVEQGFQRLQLPFPPQLLHIPEHRCEVRAAPALDGDALTAFCPVFR